MTTTDGRSQLRRSGREMVMPTQALMLRFRIELQESDPLIWREIEVPGDYTFWDLHVAIQDAMGWLDYHLHRFTMPHPRTKQERVFGIHNLSQDCDDPPGWAHQVASMFTFRNDTALYEYDFGDDWRHTVRLVDAVRRDFKLRYPRCVGGERACPPEDCGGPKAITRPASTRPPCASATRPGGWRTAGMATLRQGKTRLGCRPALTRIWAHDP
jgi:hypothetical protein